LFKETVELRNKLVVLEQERVLKTREVFDGKKGSFAEALEIIKAESGILTLLRLRLGDDKKGTAKSRESLEVKLKEIGSSRKVPDAVRSGLNVALANADNHVECMSKFVDAMEGALRITRSNLTRYKKGLAIKKDPTPYLDAAQKYLAEDETCLNNVVESMWAIFVDSEKLGEAILTGQI